VCRFYGFGPNSHVYTADADECAALKKAGTGWTYEGIAFYATVPMDGLCVSGTTPLFRLYNALAQSNDSNHRYTIDPVVYAQMQTQGWTGEGAVMCVVNVQATNAQ
jgi:serine protease